MELITNYDDVPTKVGETSPRSSMPQPDLEYILGYGSSGWLSGHLRAGEIGNASCG